MVKTILLATTLLALPFQSALARPALPFVVILDPGHGGEDTGAIRAHRAKKIAEKDVTLAIAREAEKILKAKNIAVKLTRSGDRFIDLDARTEFANKTAQVASQAVFVSIHANAVEDAKSAGIETYVFNAATNQASQRLADLENGGRWSKSHGTIDLILADLATTANYADSADLACSIQKRVVRELNRNGFRTRDRGIRQALFYVLMQTTMPSVLFEPGFLSNPQELARLGSVRYQRLLAQTLVDGILKWRESQKARLKMNANQLAKLSAVSKRPCQIH